MPDDDAKDDLGKDSLVDPRLGDDFLKIQAAWEGGDKTARVRIEDRQKGLCA